MFITSFLYDKKYYNFIDILTYLFLALSGVMSLKELRLLLILLATWISNLNFYFCKMPDNKQVRVF